MNMYFIALVLPADLNKQILAWKYLMQERYQCKVGLKSPAHITLIPPFWLHEEKEYFLLKDTDTLGQNIFPFILKTKNFSAFKPKTIFIDVEPNESLSNLKERTDAFFKNKDYGVKMDNRVFHPHITIATRDLYKKNFREAWPIFENEVFEEEWNADALSVLRHNKKNWDVVHTSQFGMDREAVD